MAHGCRSFPSTLFGVFTKLWFDLWLRTIQLLYGIETLETLGFWQNQILRSHQSAQKEQPPLEFGQCYHCLPPFVCTTLACTHAPSLGRTNAPIPCQTPSVWEDYFPIGKTILLRCWFLSFSWGKIQRHDFRARVGGALARASLTKPTFARPPAVQGWVGSTIALAKSEWTKMDENQGTFFVALFGHICGDMARPFEELF